MSWTRWHLTINCQEPTLPLSDGGGNRVLKRENIATRAIKDGNGLQNYTHIDQRRRGEYLMVIPHLCGRKLFLRLAFRKSDKKTPGSLTKDGPTETRVGNFLVPFIFHVRHSTTKPYLKATFNVQRSTAQGGNDKQVALGLLAILSFLVFFFLPLHRTTSHSHSHKSLSLRVILLLRHCVIKKSARASCFVFLSSRTRATIGGRGRLCTRCDSRSHGSADNTVRRETRAIVALMGI